MKSPKKWIHVKPERIDERPIQLDGRPSTDLGRFANTRKRHHAEQLAKGNETAYFKKFS